MAHALQMMESRFLTYVDVERGLAHATVEAYRRDLDRYIEWLSDHGIDDARQITTLHVEAFMQACPCTCACLRRPRPSVRWD